jgi:hypothetical protein
MKTCLDLHPHIPPAWILVVVLAAGCGAGGISGDDTGDPDAATVSDAPATCTVDVDFLPDDPTVGEPPVRANSVVAGAVSAITYNWDVRAPNGDSLPVTPVGGFDGRDVTFPIETAGDYHVVLQVDAGIFCDPFDGYLNVRAPGANDITWRFRFVPGPGIDAPPQETIRVIPGGAPFNLGDVALDGGAPISTTVTDGSGTGIAAYLRFMTSSNLMVEAYSSASGALSAHVPAATQNLLIVPADPDLAPRLITGWNPGDAISANAGTTVTGTIRRPGGAALDGARVSLRVDGVPSSVATTLANGTYVLHARPGAVTEISVAPPDASGLPGLTATLGTLGPQIDVDYDAALTTRNLAGTVIERSGSPAPGALVTFVGTMATAGSVTMGASTVPASGTIAIRAVANASGILPVNTRAPARAMNVVIALPAVAEAALIPIDLTSGVPATFDAPAMVPLTAHVIGDSPVSPVAGARLTAIPIGELAVGVLLPATGTAASDGTVTLQLAPGGTYDLLIEDPHRNRARMGVTSITAGALGDVALAPAMRIRGVLKEPGGSGAARYTSIEAFCTSCSGITAQRPAGEASTNVVGEFSIAILDPGTTLPAAGAIAAMPVTAD